MMQTKEGKIHEFFSNEGIYNSNYEYITTKIIDKIYNSGFTFALDYAVDESRINWGDRKIWIRIRKGTTPQQYVWNLLHEYGHYMSGERPKNYIELDELKREEDAWDNALKEIYDFYPELHKDVEDFNNHREHCLVNYRIKHEIFKKKLGL